MRWSRLPGCTLGAAVLWMGLCVAQTPEHELSPESVDTQLEVQKQQAPVATAPAREEVLVTGEFPGPGMWKVMRRDDPQGHVLWILGTPPPLPKKLKWKSKDVEAVLLSSQAVLVGSEISVEPSEKIGF